ncbi:unnamed protein product, partial [Closterium sp. NIES-65]
MNAVLAHSCLHSSPQIMGAQPSGLVKPSYPPLVTRIPQLPRFAFLPCPLGATCRLSPEPHPSGPRTLA